MITRRSGSARRIRSALPWWAIRAASSRSMAAGLGARWYNQPTAQLYHVSVTRPFLIGSAPANRKAAQCASPIAATTASITLSRMASGWGDRVWLRGAGSARSRRDLWRRPQRGDQDPSVDRSGAEHLADPGAARPTCAPIAPSRFFSRRKIRTGCTTRPIACMPADDGGNSWQTISEDLTRPSSGSPPSASATCMRTRRRCSAA